MEPGSRLSEADIERAMIIIKNQIEGNMPPESMMIEPTESETKETLDEFVETMIEIDKIIIILIVFPS